MTMFYSSREDKLNLKSKKLSLGVAQPHIDDSKIENN